MGDLIRFFMNNPILLVILIGWGASLIGGVLKRAASSPPRPSARPQAPAARPQAQRTQAPTLRPLVQRSQPQRRTPEEVADEVRRLLGMGREPPPEPKPAANQTQARAQSLLPRPERAPLSRALGDPLATSRNRASGEEIADRKEPMSGKVGSDVIGDLGGRARRVVPHRRHLHSRFADLHDPAAAMVLREIFDRPLGLRDLLQ
jgi:hypothetical protein